ncbi:MAG: amidohydrolase family protein [Dehalococcoidia bacterium]|nr:amidohydrolase family protein [Dehalococcoidia bacterium]
MKIDIFCHITPPRFLKAFEKRVPQEICKQLPCRLLPSLTDLDLRFRVMDEFEDMVQVLTLTNPPIETVAEPADAIELARIVNDEMAELVAKYPDRFVGAVACLPLNDMDAAMREADRAIKDLHHYGIQIYNTIRGKPLDSPEFMPLWEKMVKYDLPIWIHPFYPYVGTVARDKDQFATYRVFTGREDYAWALNRAVFGLPSETAYAVTRLVYSPVLDTYPNIKFVLHHCGSSIPYFAGRISILQNMFQVREQIDHGLRKPILEYYKMFYVDSALHGNSLALMCGHGFYGIDHILFGSDMPFDSEIGRVAVQQTVQAVEQMGITTAEKKKIYEDNAKKLLRLSI